MKKLLLITTVLFAFNGNAQLRLVKDLDTSGASVPGSFYEHNGRLYFSATVFSASTSTFIRYLFLTDGTTNGTLPIRFGDGTTGTLAVSPNAAVNFYSYNSELYFDAKIGNFSSAYLSKMSGSSNVTNAIYDITTDTSSSTSNFKYPVGLNNKLIFNPISSVNPYGVEPIVVDLVTSANTNYLKNISIASSSNPTEFTVLGTNCFFSATDDTNGREIWKTDGTPTGTVLYLDLNTGLPNSNPDLFNVLSSQLTFVATHTTLGRELFKTNGSGSLTLIKDINTTGDSNPANATVVGADLYFSANNGTAGQELWKSNGNNLGTVLLKDINPTGDSNPSNFTQVGSTIYFLANDGVNGIDLWKTDGTNSGTTLVNNVVTGTQVIQNLTAYNGKLYFIVNDPSLGFNNRGLWVSDGTAIGTQMVLANTFDPRNLYVFGNELYMAANFNNTTSIELCAYLDPALSTNDFELNEKAITLFPNPSATYFELSDNVNVENVEIYSLQGQLVKSFSHQNQYTISDLAKGIYLIKIKATEGSLNKSLIVE